MRGNLVRIWHMNHPVLQPPQHKIAWFSAGNGLPLNHPDPPGGEGVVVKPLGGFSARRTLLPVAVGKIVGKIRRAHRVLGDACGLNAAIVDKQSRHRRVACDGTPNMKVWILSRAQWDGFESVGFPAVPRQTSASLLRASRFNYAALTVVSAACVRRCPNIA